MVIIVKRLPGWHHRLNCLQGRLVAANRACKALLQHSNLLRLEQSAQTGSPDGAQRNPGMAKLESGNSPDSGVPRLHPGYKDLTFVWRPSTSCISNRPASLSTSQLAARSAPLAKVMRDAALWVISTISPAPANITV